MWKNLVCLLLACASVATIALTRPRGVEPPAVMVLPVAAARTAILPSSVSIVRSTDALLQAQLLAHINIEARITPKAHLTDQVRALLLQKAAALGANAVVIRVYATSPDLGQRLVVYADAYHAYLI